MIRVNQAENNCETYPTWICVECAVSNGGKWPLGHVAICHSGICGWCDKNRSVTQAKEYGYPHYKWR